MALDRRSADHLVVKNDGKGRADVLGGVIAEFAGAGRVKPEIHRRTAVLVKTRLRVDKLFTRHDRSFLKHIVGARLVQRGQNLVRCRNGGVGVARAAHNRLKRQLGGGADPAL